MDQATEKNTREYDIHAEEWHAAMQSNVGHQYLEKPAMVSLLPPDLSNQSVLCIGVGSGEELEELLKRHPARIIGIDTSEKLLEIAEKKFPGVEFMKMDMNDLHFPGR